MREVKLAADGYVRVHENNKWFLEHRRVMEGVLSRKLEWPKEVVHHINGDRTDNRPENLMLMDNGAHGRHHCYKPDTWEMLICPQCEESFRARKCEKRKFCSVQCHHASYH